MKNLLFLLLCISSLGVAAQNTKNEYDGPQWNVPYNLNTEGWSIERFQIPIEFAPQIPYTGVEDIRFTPGWGDVKSDEYWTYAFLWYLDGKPKTNAEIIQNNLNAYYDGLIGRNIAKRKIPAEKIVPTKTSVQKIKTVKGDVKTFSGTIEMLDYMEQKPIVLNCIVHQKSCSGQNKSFLFYEISPLPFTDGMWERLNGLWTNFDCQKAGDKK